MHKAAKIITAGLLAMLLTGCATSLATWQVGAGLLGGGAAIWGAHAQAENVKIQRETLLLQAETARLQAWATEASIRLQNTQRQYYEEQRMQAVAAREVECGNHVHASNSFATTVCQGLNRTSVCKYVYAAAKRSPDVCLPTLRYAGYRV